MDFRFRLMITICLLIALTFGLGGSVLLHVSFLEDLEEKRTEALEAFETTQNTLLLLSSLSDKVNHASLAGSLSQIENSGITTWQAISLTSEGLDIYEKKPEALAGYAVAPSTPGVCSYLEISDSFGQAILVTGTLDAGDEYLILCVRFDLSEVYVDRAEQQRLFLGIYYIVIILGAMTAAVLSFVMTGKLRKLTVAVRQIASGNLAERSYLTSRDEFGQLSRDIDVMADKLQENIDKLQTQVQRQESFIGAFAHELKTPMTSIIGYADLLRQDGLDNTKRQRAINYIFTEGQRLEKLSFKLLDMLLLQKEAPEMKIVQLAAFSQEIENVLKPVLSQKGVQLTCRGERNKARFEPDLVKSLLYNLIDNAAKAIDGNGSITLSAIALPRGCQFTVIDNGRGMEQEELSKITEAFYRVDKARSRMQGGAGLGLALCQQIVASHGGNMRFTSKPGAGTKVVVTLYEKGGKSDA